MSLSCIRRSFGAVTRPLRMVDGLSDTFRGHLQVWASAESEEEAVWSSYCLIKSLIQIIDYSLCLVMKMSEFFPSLRKKQKLGDINKNKTLAWPAAKFSFKHPPEPEITWRRLREGEEFAHSRSASRGEIMFYFLYFLFNNLSNQGIKKKNLTEFQESPGKDGRQLKRKKSP